MHSRSRIFIRLLVLLGILSWISSPAIAGYPAKDSLPPNDNFADRIRLAPGTIRASGTNEGATSEPSEPSNPPSAGGQSVWWEWVSPASGPVTIDTIDSTFDTTLAIYTGTDLGTLSLVGENDDIINVNSSVTFDAVAGESYKVQVNGYADSTGQIYLNYPMPFPVAVTPGSLRTAGLPGGTVQSGITLTNGDDGPVGFSISSPAGWIIPSPGTGSIPAGGEVEIVLSMGPLPAFADSLSSDLLIDLTHPSLASIGIPIEVIHLSLVVDIPDANLRRVLELHLNRLPGEPISASEMAILTSFDGMGFDISNLTGLEYGVNLFELFLGNNQISDLSPLSSLGGLSFLDLIDNNISDLAPLAGLPYLLNLDVRLNYLDISPGSDDRIIIDALNSFGDVLYDPQKSGMLTLTEWISLHAIPAESDGELDINGPLAIPNILAFAMGLDPFSATASELPVAHQDPDNNLYSFTYYRDLKALGITTSTLTSYELNTWTVAVPTEVHVLWDDGDGHQRVEAIFEDPAKSLFFSLEAKPY